MGLFDCKSGERVTVRRKMDEKDAFRCAHWLSSMAFLRVERSHIGNILSKLRSDKHYKRYVTERHQKEIDQIEAVAGTAVTLGSTGVGALIGTAIFPGLGTGAGLLIGAFIGLATTAIGIGMEKAFSEAKRKTGRAEIKSRLTKSDFDYRKEIRERQREDEIDRSGHLYRVAKGDTLAKIARRYRNVPLTKEYRRAEVQKRGRRLKSLLRRCRVLKGSTRVSKKTFEKAKEDLKRQAHSLRKVKDPGSKVTLYDILNHPKNEDIVYDCRTRAPFFVPREAVSLNPFKGSFNNLIHTEVMYDLDVWIPGEINRELDLAVIADDLHDMGYLSTCSLRDSVMHLCRATDILDRESRRSRGLVDGLALAPAFDDTIESFAESVDNSYPWLKPSLVQLVEHPENGNEPYVFETFQGDTLAQVEATAGCPWDRVLYHSRNRDLRNVFVRAGVNPESKEVRESTPIPRDMKIYVPRRLPYSQWEQVVRLDFVGGRLTEREGHAGGLDPTEPIWIPSGRSYSKKSFSSCDDMIQKCDAAAEFTHHLNKTRNYLLPTLNLAVMYLETFGEIDNQYVEAKELIESAVLRHMRAGAHQKCELGYAFKKLAKDCSKLNKERKKPDKKLSKMTLSSFNCILAAHHEATRSEAGETIDIVKGSSLSKIAQANGIPLQALLVKNKEKVQSDSTNGNGANNDHGVNLTAMENDSWNRPRRNAIDEYVYRLGLNRLGIDQSSKYGGHLDLHSSFEDNFWAKLSENTVSREELDKELRDMAQKLRKRLAKNRSWHADRWTKAKGGERRFYHFYSDLLQRHDMPSKTTQLRHWFTNIDKRETDKEKIEFVATSAVKMVAGVIIDAGKTGANEGIKKLLKVDTGYLELFKAVMKKTNIGRQLSAEILDNAASKSGDKLQELIEAIPGWVADKCAASAIETRISSNGLLGFDRERMIRSIQASGGDELSHKQKTFLEAAKELEDLFPKLSRHTLAARQALESSVMPMFAADVATGAKKGPQIASCQDAYEKLRLLYELQHERDKAVRYLLSILSIALRLTAWEEKLSESEKRMFDNLVKSAYAFIGDESIWLKSKDGLVRNEKGLEATQKRHEDCLKSKRLYCYGPSASSPDNSRRPLGVRDDRPPDSPDDLAFYHALTDEPPPARRKEIKRRRPAPPPPTKPLPRLPRKKVTLKAK